MQRGATPIKKMRLRLFKLDSDCEISADIRVYDTYTLTHSSSLSIHARAPNKISFFNF